MNSINEEVRQEVRIRICNIRRCLDEDKFGQATSESDALIIYILSAVRDGKQKILGEEWRAAFDGYLCLPDEFSTSGIIDGVIDSDWKESDYDYILVALRPEKGEKDGD